MWDHYDWNFQILSKNYDFHSLFEKKIFCKPILNSLDENEKKNSFIVSLFERLQPTSRSSATLNKKLVDISQNTMWFIVPVLLFFGIFIRFLLI